MWARADTIQNHTPMSPVNLSRFEAWAYLLITNIQFNLGRNCPQKFSPHWADVGHCQREKTMKAGPIGV